MEVSGRAVCGSHPQTGIPPPLVEGISSSFDHRGEEEFGLLLSRSGGLWNVELMF